MQSKPLDVIVVGGGVCGITCTRLLTKQGLKVKLIEANERLGGRILTQKIPELGLPIELGAEFIHGKPQILIDEFDRSGQPFMDVTDRHIRSDETSVHAEDFWSKLGGIEKFYRADRNPDQSIRQFADSLTQVDEESRDLYLGYIEGFHACNPSHASEKVLALAKKEADGWIDDSQLFRSLNGYGHLIKKMVDEIDPQVLLTQSKVKQINWQKNKVEVIGQSGHGDSFCFTSNKVIVTVPISVLKSNRPESKIDFNPHLPALTHMLGAFEMGHAERMVFVFKERFWEKWMEGSLSFLHTHHRDFFPTWWSMDPIKAPILVAWQGGPKALEVSAMPIHKRIELALATLSKLFKTNPENIQRQVQNVYTHNWSQQDHFLGAYSYVVVGGAEACQSLVNGLEQTVFFAGEAFASHANRATVHGAMASGVFVAQSLLKPGI